MMEKIENKCLDAAVNEIKNINQLRTNNKRDIRINPPPDDDCCECCGRHISKLKPFDGPEGALLVKNFRRLCVDSQVDATWECKDCIGLSLEEFNKKLKQRKKN